jgi:dihydroorotate dehydrogenase
MGVGGINDAASAVERIEAGAQAIQVVTAVRQRRGKIARAINLGILARLEKDGLGKVQDLVGISA